jgi:hypothetical protein
MAQDATGLLIIRAWVENGSSDPLRAHLSITTDVSAGIQDEQNLVDIDTVCSVVQGWLTGLMTD